MTGPASEHFFELVALPLMDQVMTTALYLTRNQTEAEDLVQETYLRAYRFWERFEPGTNCRAWLLTIAHNQFRNRYREKQRSGNQVELDENLLDAETAGDSAERVDPEQLVLSQMLDEEVEQAMRSLPADYLEAVLLVDLQELTYEEAAEAMACPVGTVRSRLSRGRRRLHASLLDYARGRGLVREEK